MPKTLALRCGIKRRYGDHEIYFEIAEQVEVENGQGRRDAFNNLLGQLEDQIKVYEAVSLPHVRLPQNGNTSQSSGVVSDTFPLGAIVVESVKGQRRVAAMGGRWAKHGVPVYAECATDLDIALLDYGTHDFSHLNMTVTVELVDGKPKRVRSIK